MFLVRLRGRAHLPCWRERWWCGCWAGGQVVCGRPPHRLHGPHNLAGGL